MAVFPEIGDTALSSPREHWKDPGDGSSLECNWEVLSGLVLLFFKKTDFK